MEAKGVFSMVSRESALVANNLLLAVSCFVVFVGTLWPVVAEMAFDRKLSVGAPFFNAAFPPFMVALGLLLPLGAMLPWKRAKVKKTAVSLRYAAVLALALAGLVWAIQSDRSLLGPVGVFLGAWIVSGAALDLWTRAGRSGQIGRLLRLPRADWGKAFAHAGLGITIFAIAGLTAWQKEDIRVANLNEPFSVGPFELTLVDVVEGRGPNYFTTMGVVEVTKNGRPEATLNPEKRVYPVAQMPTTEAAIDYRFTRDLYVVIGDAQEGGGYTMRTYIKPFANWIWGGCLLMAIGGCLACRIVAFASPRAQRRRRCRECLPNDPLAQTRTDAAGSRDNAGLCGATRRGAG